MVTKQFRLFVGAIHSGTDLVCLQEESMGWSHWFNFLCAPFPRKKYICKGPSSHKEKITFVSKGGSL